MVGCNKTILCSSIFNNRILRIGNCNIFNTSYMTSFVNGNFGNMSCITISTISRPTELMAQGNLFISCISINLSPSVTRSNCEGISFCVRRNSDGRRLTRDFVSFISALGGNGNIRPSVLVDFTATSDSILNSSIKCRKRLLQRHVVRNITVINRRIPGQSQSNNIGGSDLTSIV